MSEELGCIILTVVFFLCSYGFLYGLERWGR